MNEQPALVNYVGLEQYLPAYRDFVIWTGWFNVWYGVVIAYHPGEHAIDVIFESGSPAALFTMAEQDQARNTRRIPLQQIKAAPQGTWTIQRHDTARHCTLWYV